VGEDRQLVAQAARGDDGAFELLVHRYSEDLWRLARTLLRNDAEAEEAVQDTFLKAYRSLASFRGDASFRTWLHHICQKTCIDRIRARRVITVPLTQLPENAERPSAETKMILEETLLTLREDDRMAFLLVHFLGYTREEAARICGVPSSTMRTRVVRARRRLAEILEDTDAPEDAE
jgi:RNA polymerase sigma-70 factor, ECF subfamily